MLRYTAPELVPTTFIDSVIASWERYVCAQMDRDCQQLADVSAWLYQEAMEYLCVAVLEQLGVEMPLLVSISLIDGGECEIVLVWSAATKLDPGEVINDCIVTRVADIVLPAQRAFINHKRVRHDTIAKWACSLSAVADYLPQKEA